MKKLSTATHFWNDWKWSSWGFLMQWRRSGHREPLRSARKQVEYGKEAVELGQPKQSKMPGLITWRPSQSRSSNQRKLQWRISVTSKICRRKNVHTWGFSWHQLTTVIWQRYSNFRGKADKIWGSHLARTTSFVSLLVNTHGSPYLLNFAPPRICGNQGCSATYCVVCGVYKPLCDVFKSEAQQGQ